MTTGEQLQSGLTRFFALRQQGDDAVFLSRLHELRRVQALRLRASHADLFADPTLKPALDFLLTDIYGAANLLPVAQDIQRALPLALKLLPDKVMATAANALEAAIVTQELDEALVVVLGTKLDAPLTDADYIAGYLTLRRHAERIEQLKLVNAFGGTLERYVRSKLLLGTFKVVKKPAHKAGFGHLYAFMERCFAVMKPVPDAQALLTLLVERETAIMQKLFAGDPAPFATSRQVP